MTNHNDRLYRLLAELDEINADIDKLHREIKIVDKVIADVRADIAYMNRQLDGIEDNRAEVADAAD